jgi:hypothetical protein
MCTCGFNTGSSKASEQSKTAVIQQYLKQMMQRRKLPLTPNEHATYKKDSLQSITEKIKLMSLDQRFIREVLKNRPTGHSSLNIIRCHNYPTYYVFKYFFDSRNT